MSTVISITATFAFVIQPVTVPLSTPNTTKTTVVNESVTVRFVTTPVKSWTTRVSGPAKTLKSLTNGTSGIGIPNYAGILG